VSGFKRHRLEETDVLIQKTAEQSLPTPDAIPRIGPLTATALIAAIGNGATFFGGESSGLRS
jgi:transposase